jgi:hypothetical protein
MDMKENNNESVSQTFNTILVTKGRKTGREHAVMLRAVHYNKKYYFSRHLPNSDWYKNAIKVKIVKIKIKDQFVSGMATKVTDVSLLQKISHLKYPNQERAKEHRVAIQVTLDI